MSSYGQPTVFDSHPPELYGSVGGGGGGGGGESAKRGEGFLRKEEGLAEAAGGSLASGAASSSNYTSLLGRDPASEYYDYIPGEPPVGRHISQPLPPPPPPPADERRATDGAGRGRDHQSGRGSVGERKVAQNSLYEIHDQKPLMHPSLSRADKEKGGVEDTQCGCSTKSLALAFLVAMGLLLAVASLGLSLLMFFGVNNSGEDPTVTVVTPEIGECSCPEDIELLKEDLQSLTAMIDDMNLTLNKIESHSVVDTNTLPVVLSTLEELDSMFINVSDRFYSEPPLFRLYNITPMAAHCTTEVQSSCTLPSDGGGNCTSDFVELNETDSFIHFPNCLYHYTARRDVTILIAVLEVRADKALRCSCTRLGAPEVEVQCQLVVTSCPLQWELGGGA